MRHTERELARILHTGPFHLALRTALSVRGLPSTGCSTIWPTGASSSG